MPDNIADFMTGRQFWDRLCATQPVPPESSGDLAFRGGQCAIEYYVQGVLLRTDLSGPQEFGHFLPGPIQRIFWTVVDAPDIAGKRYYINTVDATGFLRSTLVGAEQFGATPVYDRYIKIFPPTDNCGDRPIVPDLPAVPPPTSFIVNNININGQVGDVEVSLPDLNVNDWPDFEFSPTIDVGGIRATFELGGINVTLPGGASIADSDSPTNLQPVLDRIDESTLAVRTDISEVITDIEEVSELINERFDDLESLIRCCCCEESVTYEISALSTNSSGGRYELPPNTVAVRIIGSDIDVERIRVQPGSGTSPSVYFWGWYSIAYGDGDGGDRIPLSFVQTAVVAFPGARYIAVCPYFGAKCTVIAIVKNKNCTDGG